MNFDLVTASVARSKHITASEQINIELIMSVAQYGYIITRYMSIDV